MVAPYRLFTRPLDSLTRASASPFESLSQSAAVSSVLLDSASLEEPVSAVVDTLITITGSAEWSIDATNASAIRYASIQFWEEGGSLFGLSDRLVGETFLDETGQFEFQVPLSALTSGKFSQGQPTNFFFIIQSESVGSTDDAYSVIDADTGKPFQVGFDLGDLTPFLASNTAFDNRIEVTDPLRVPYLTDEFLTPNNLALSIFDTIYTGFTAYQSIAGEAGGMPASPLDIIAYGEKTEYNPNTQTIYVTGDNLGDWDVILHEFSHYLADINDLENSPGDLHQPGQSSIGINVFDTENGTETLDRSKDEGVRLAWDEGFATYLAIALQHLAAEENSLPANIPGVSATPTGAPDNVFTGVNIDTGAAFNLQLESGFSFLTQGEGDEASIYRVLWDLGDGANESNDSVQVRFGTGLNSETGHAALYQMLDQSIAKGELDQIADVWNLLYTNPDYIQLPTTPLPADPIAVDNFKRAKVGELFETHGIAPQLTQLPENFLVEFAWNVGNRAPTSAIPGEILGNDSFDILIFDQDFELYFVKTLNETNVLNGVNADPQWIIDAATGTASWVPNLDDRATLRTGVNYVVIAGNDTQVGTGSGASYAPNEQTWNYWSGAHEFTIEAMPGQDDDSDGVPDGLEALAGDGNGDGILDNQQANVASFLDSSSDLNQPASFVTIATPAGTLLSDVNNSTIFPLNAPGEVEFSLDLLSFTVESVAVGGLVQVELFLPEGVEADTYWKYDSTQGWYEFLYDGETGAEFIDTDGDGTSDLIRLHLVDGGRGDADGSANGVILDPGAPGLTNPLSPGENTPPVLVNEIADQVATVGQPFSFTLPTGTFIDADAGDSLTYSLRITRDLLRNGSFELSDVPESFNYISLNPGSTTIQDWTVTRDQIDYYQDEWVAADGDRSLDLNGSPGVGGIAQTFTTEVGRQYTVTFALAGHNSGLLQTLGVSAAGATGIFEFQANQDSNALGWTNETWQFTATSPETTLEFYSLQTFYPFGGPALDDVAVVVSDAPLPDWLTFDTITGTFSGTPTAGADESFDIEIIATDSAGFTASDEFSLVVQGSETVPHSGIADATTTGTTELLPGVEATPLGTSPQDFTALDSGLVEVITG